MKKNANANCSTNGMSFHNSAGAWNNPRIGEVPSALPATTANTAIQKTQMSTRRIRKRVQSLILLRAIRFIPPNTEWVQNR